MIMTRITEEACGNKNCFNWFSYLVCAYDLIFHFHEQDHSVNVSISIQKLKRAIDALHHVTRFPHYFTHSSLICASWASFNVFDLIHESNPIQFTFSFTLYTRNMINSKQYVQVKGTWEFFLIIVLCDFRVPRPDPCRVLTHYSADIHDATKINISLSLC